VPAALSGSTCSAASLLTAGFGEPAGPAAALAHGVMHAMSFRKLKLAAAVLVGAFGVGSFSVMNKAEAKPADGHRVVRRNAPVPEKKLREWKELFAVKLESAVTAVAVCEDMLVTGYAADNRGCNIHTWNPANGETLGTRIRGAFSHVPPDALRFVGENKLLVMTVPGGGIARYERREGGLLVGYWTSDDVIVHGFSDDLQVVAASPMKDRETRLHVSDDPWKNPIGLRNPIGSIHFTEKEALVRAALSGDGKRLVVANVDHTIRFHGFDGKKLDERRKIDLSTKPTVTALKLSDDGKRLAVIGEKGFAKVFDADNGAELCELKGHNGTVNATAFTPDGTQVATANGKMVRVFDAKSGKLLGEIKGHTDDVTCLAFAADGKRLVTGSKDKTAKVWEVK
jgi:WD40 repeat protein